MDDQPVLLELRGEADQRVRAIEPVGMGVTMPVHLARHRRTAVLGHGLIVPGRRRACTASAADDCEPGVPRGQGPVCYAGGGEVSSGSSSWNRGA